MPLDELVKGKTPLGYLILVKTRLDELVLDELTCSQIYNAITKGS